MRRLWLQSAEREGDAGDPLGDIRQAGKGGEGGVPTQKSPQVQQLGVGQQEGILGIASVEIKRSHTSVAILSVVVGCVRV